MIGPRRSVWADCDYFTIVLKQDSSKNVVKKTKVSLIWRPPLENVSKYLSQHVGIGKNHYNVMRDICWVYPKMVIPNKCSSNQRTSIVVVKNAQCDADDQGGCSKMSTPNKCSLNQHLWIAVVKNGQYEANIRGLFKNDDTKQMFVEEASKGFLS